MKNLLLVLVVIALASCQKENIGPVDASKQNTVDTFDQSKAKLLSSGTVAGVNHTASGSVGLYNNTTNAVVYFDKLSAQDGPDLKIYLSKDINAQDYIKLGNLKSTSGAQSYNVPANVDVTGYKYVHIWCERYTVIFARAELK
jgi:hypothetical protein